MCNSNGVTPKNSSTEFKGDCIGEIQTDVQDTANAIIPSTHKNPDEPPPKAVRCNLIDNDLDLTDIRCNSTGAIPDDLTDTRCDSNSKTQTRCNSHSKVLNVNHDEGYTTTHNRNAPDQSATANSESPINHSLPHKLCPGDLIKITNTDSSDAILKIHSRAGKATGIWAHSWNVIDTTGVIKSVDLKKDV